MNEHKFEKQYQVWIFCGYQGWRYAEFDTLEECLDYSKGSEEWKISQRVNFKITKVEEIKLEE